MRLVLLLVSIQMKKLINNSNDLEVDDIIERVLVRNHHQRYDYHKKDTQQLTSQQHLWHYALQQQNVELKEKIKELSSQFKKKVANFNQFTNLQKQIKALKIELDNVLKSNVHLQQQINEMRLKNSSINDSIQNSLDESIKNRKNNRSCSCISSQNMLKNPSHPHRVSKITINQPSLSPQKEILKTKKDVSVICLLSNQVESQMKTINSKKQHINTLRRIIQNQQKLIASYSKQIENHKGKQLCKNKTMESTSRLNPLLGHAVSYTTFKPLSSAGSIIKIRRK